MEGHFIELICLGVAGQIFDLVIFGWLMVVVVKMKSRLDKNYGLTLVSSRVLNWLQLRNGCDNECSKAICFQLANDC